MTDINEVVNDNTPEPEEAGWYDDLLDPDYLRYWDGSEWTTKTVFKYDEDEEHGVHLKTSEELEEDETENLTEPETLGTGFKIAVGVTAAFIVLSGFVAIAFQ